MTDNEELIRELRQCQCVELHFYDKYSESKITLHKEQVKEIIKALEKK